MFGKALSNKAVRRVGSQVMGKLRGWGSLKREEGGIRGETQSQAPGDGLGRGGPRGRAETLRSSRLG